MYQGSSIVGTFRDGKKVPMLVYVFNEGLVVVESIDPELLASKKTLTVYGELDFWRHSYEPSAKRLGFAAFSALPKFRDTSVSSWSEATLSSVRWIKEGGWLSMRVLKIERTDGSSLDLVLYAADERAELIPLRDYCKKAFGLRYMTK